MTKNEEFAVKLERVRAYLATHGLSAVILGRADNFAWLGCGANNVVNSAAETGVAAFAVRRDRVVLIANNIEAERLATEELEGLDLSDTEVFPWHEPSERSEVVNRVTDNGNAAADDGTSHLPPLPGDFARLRYSLTGSETCRYREVCADVSRAMENTAHAVERGMTEADVAAQLALECLRKDVSPIVLLVAADDRVPSWRHPIPKTTPIEQYVMMVVCGRRQGLVAAMTRLVHFGELGPDLAERHRAVCTVDAAMIAATRPGVCAADVFITAQRAYRDNGFPGEWMLHHQGGAIGYQPRDYIATPDCKHGVLAHQAFAWNPSIRGTKSEDTILVTAGAVEVMTAASAEWPMIEVPSGDGTMKRPDMLVK